VNLGIVGDEVAAEAGFEFLALLGGAFDPRRAIGATEDADEGLKLAFGVGDAGGQGGLRQVADVLGELAIEIALGIGPAECEQAARFRGEAAELHGWT
jgi:hypothetical protein